MRRPRFRLTLRTLLIAVAFATLAAWGYTMWRRSAEFASEASKHKIDMWSIRASIGGVGWYRDMFFHRVTDRDKTQQVIRLRWLRYEEQMYLKYRRAARLPWLPVASDPPPPAEMW